MKASLEETERAFDKNERQMSELVKQTKQANGPAVGGFVLTAYTNRCVGVGSDLKQLVVDQHGFLKWLIIREQVR